MTFAVTLERVLHGSSPRLQPNCVGSVAAGRCITRKWGSGAAGATGVAAATLLWIIGARGCTVATVLWIIGARGPAVATVLWIIGARGRAAASMLRILGARESPKGAEQRAADDSVHGSGGHNLYQVQAELRAKIEEVAQGQHNERVHRTEIREEQMAIRSSLSDLETDLQAQTARVQTHLGDVSSYGESQCSLFQKVEQIANTIPTLASRHITNQHSCKQISRPQKL